MARRLAKILEYAEFRNFLPVIDKEKKACEVSEQAISDHFVQMYEMVDIGSGAFLNSKQRGKSLAVNNDS